MTKPSINLQELRRRIYRKAKAEKTWRFWGLYVHVTRAETLREAYREAKANDGAPGLDGVSFEDIEAQGVEKFLAAIRQELLTGTYQPTQEPTGRDSQGERQDPQARNSHHQGSRRSGSCKAYLGVDL